MKIRRKNATRTLKLAVALDTSLDFTNPPEHSKEKAIFMHSRMGIRIDFNIRKSQLALWLSPQAGRSLDYRDRNFSNRDDHTSIFDEISFPELHERDFTGCNYDAFHSTLLYGKKNLHILSLFDDPAIVVWSDAQLVVDLKSDKQDSIAVRSATAFAMRHPDRGRVFDFAAVLSGREGLLHQPETDDGRSTYARAVLAPRQLLIIGAELVKERVLGRLRALSRKSVRSMLRENERSIGPAAAPGTPVIKDATQMQRLFDMNKRHLLSAFDASGAIRAALKYVYYLIWTTDGTVTATSLAQAGDHAPLEHWLRFLLANPTRQSAPPRGRFFGQLANGKITKREEFGVFCAVWPAFVHAGLTGDDTFVRGKYLAVLEDAVSWLERYCFDEKVGAIGTYYHAGGSEDPFFGSNDFGWDSAVGRPMNRDCYAPRHEGRLILRAYEYNMNLNQVGMYLFLASVTSGKKALSYKRKAETLERFLLSLRARHARALYRLEGKKSLAVVPYPQGTEETGELAIQSRSPAPFMPAFRQTYMARQRAFAPLTKESVRGKMPCYVYGVLAGLDTEHVREDDVFRSLEATLEYNIRPSEFMPMAYTMVETLGASGGEYNDIRPQAFSAGPFQAAVTNLAVRTMPFGIALRASNHIAALKHYQFGNGFIDIHYAGKGAIRRIRLNGQPLAHTLQIPEDRIKRGRNTLEVDLAKPGDGSPVLTYSTLRLRSTRTVGRGIEYRMQALAQNVLIIRNLLGTLTVTDAAGRKVPHEAAVENAHTFIEFDARGEVTVTIEP